MSMPINLTNITRDNFDPARVLESLRNGDMTIGETERLLEEACHAFHRKSVLLVNAKAIVANLQQDLGNL